MFYSSGAETVVCGFDSGLIPKSGSGYEPFVSDAVVSLNGSEEHVLLKLLRDTGAKDLLWSWCCLFHLLQ